VGETGLPHVAESHEPARDAHANLGHEFLGRLRTVPRENVGDGVAKVESPAVRPVPERFDLRDAREALFQQIVFEGQIGLLRVEYVIIKLRFAPIDLYHHPRLQRGKTFAGDAPGH
jgi:hypothetical protein